ncbi:MAG: family 43 glycosylhydrolase [Clostridia bacterium]|nr:family 43 glycosylhydrolase [Clostridia bacterium]
MSHKKRTICNPVNISYQYQFDYHSRESADPAVVVYEGKYFLFASHGSGYWVSEDLAEWEFIHVDPQKQPEFNLFAPGVCVVGKTMYVTHSQGGSILKSDDPTDPDSWVDIGKPYDWFDPAFFADDDGYVYAYEGLSMYHPIRVAKLDPKNDMKLVEGPFPCIESDVGNRGFERLGDNNEIGGELPYFEGAWMNKYNGKYYLTYAAPDTKYASYADGCFVGDGPMGPFTYCKNSPVAWKNSGFLRGAGHGCLFEDLKGNWWKMDTVSISVNHEYERRLILLPAKFGDDGLLYTNAVRSDYPMYVPTENDDPFNTPGPDWNLLSYGKKAKASSVLDEDCLPSFAFDENIKTWWSADSGKAGEWLEVDLGDVCTVCGIQVNFADQDAENVGGRDCTCVYRYKLEASVDGESFETLVDHSDNSEDYSHEYFETPKELKTRYIRLTNMGETPAGGRFAVSGLRVFGYGNAPVPTAVNTVTCERLEDERMMSVSWSDAENAEGYIVRFGINPDELNLHYNIHGQTNITLKCLNKGVDYYVTVDAYNESGVANGIGVVKVPTRM